MGIRKQREARLIIDNYEIYSIFRERLMNIRLSQFTYTNLPKTMDRLTMERAFMFNGTCSLLRPEGTDLLLSLPYVMRGNFNAYGYPVSIFGYSMYNSKQFTPATSEPVPYDASSNVFTPSEFTVGWDNNMRTRCVRIIEQYAKLLWEVYTTFRSNLTKQKTPYLILADKSQRLTADNIMLKLEAGDDAIEVNTGSLNIDDTIKALDLRVDFKGPELLAVLQSIWEMALSQIGVSSPQEKRERLINNELMMMREEDHIQLNSGLQQRQEMFDRAWDLWGGELMEEKVEVHSSSGIDTTFPLPDQLFEDGLEGGLDYGDVHNKSTRQTTGDSEGAGHN